jgi:hypothetical protein
LLILERTQRNWLIAFLVLVVAALVPYLVVYFTTPEGLTGGDVIGMWYGIAGLALMLYAAALSLLRRVPSWWWIGSRKTWLRGHVWLGMLSGILILCHSGFRWGGPLEFTLAILTLLVLGTGLAGLAAQQIVPRLLTARISAEAPWEQIPALCAAMRQQADNRLDKLRERRDTTPPQLDADAFTRLEAFYLKQVRPFLDPRAKRSLLLAHPLTAEALFAQERSLPVLAPVVADLDWLEVLCNERRQLAEQERLHLILHGWLLVHVPLSVLLLVLGLLHAVMSFYY